MINASSEPSKPAEKPAPATDVSLEPGPWSCDECTETTRHGHGAWNTKYKRYKSYICKKCNMYFADWELTTAHKKKKHRIFECPACGLKMSSERSLISHMPDGICNREPLTDSD